MATKRYKTLAQLKDSQLLYDKNPPAFGLWMILIVLAAIIIALIWSMFAPKTYVIKSQGTVISENRNYIMSAYTGEVVHAYVREGDYVNKGEKIATLYCEDEGKFAAAEERFIKATVIGDKKPDEMPLVLDVVGE